MSENNKIPEPVNEKVSDKKGIVLETKYSLNIPVVALKHRYQ